MARTKGSKNKAKELTAAAAAIMPEDLEFDRELERLGRERAHEDLPPEISDRAPVRDVVPDKSRPEMLSMRMPGTTPANDPIALAEQVHQAKMYGCDSIEATLALCKRYCRDPLLESVGYFMYHDIKVFIDGQADKARARDTQTIEQRVFGGR